MRPFKTPAGEILTLRLPLSSVKLSIEPQEDKTPCLAYYSFDNVTPSIISLPEGNWQILGQISHKGEFGFDPEPYVEAYHGFDDESYPLHGYYKYPIKERGMQMIEDKPEPSFISLIESQGEILLENPMGGKKTFATEMKGRDVVTSKDVYEFNKWEKEWQSNEDKRPKENELILIIVNR